MNTVTVGIPFNRVDDDLLCAIRSVFSQTYENWELILYGDGVSVEDAGPLLRIDDPRVSFYFSDSQRGLASTLNAIARLSKSDLLVRMDSDDLMARSRLQVTLDVFTASPDIDVLASSAVVIDEANLVQGMLHEVPIPTNPAGFLRSNVLAHPTVTARTSWFLANPYDPRFERAQDKELWLRTCESSKFFRIDDPQLFYRIRRSNVNAKVRKSAKYDRMSIWMYGYRYAGFIQTGIRLARSYMALLRSELHTALGRGEQSYEGRFRPVSDRLKKAYSEEIEKIVRYELPQRPETSGEGLP